MKVSKFTLSFLIIVICFYFLGDNIIYMRVKRLIRVMTQLNESIKLERIEMKKIATQLMEKEKELDAVKSDLEKIKKELGSLKQKP